MTWKGPGPTLRVPPVEPPNEEVSNFGVTRDKTLAEEVIQSGGGIEANIIRIHANVYTLCGDLDKICGDLDKIAMHNARWRGLCFFAWALVMWGVWR